MKSSPDIKFPVRLMLAGHVPIRTAGFILLTIGCLLLAYLCYQIVSSLMQHSEVDQMMFAQRIDDFVIASPPVINSL